LVGLKFNAKKRMIDFRGHLFFAKKHLHGLLARLSVLFCFGKACGRSKNALMGLKKGDFRVVVIVV
jgi:hypothetical protein